MSNQTITYQGLTPIQTPVVNTTHSLMSGSVAKIAPALLRAQKKMGGASKGSANPYFKSKYADYGAVLEVAKEPLNEESITILQPTHSDGSGHYVETILVHDSGEYISSGRLRLELTKTDMQSLGSAITYARRYQLQSLLGIPAEDDDAEGAMKRAAPTKESTAQAVSQVPTKQVQKTASSFKKPAAPTPAPAAATDGSSNNGGLNW